MSFEIVEPRSLSDAFSSLAGDEPGIRAIGGGTALMLMMKAHLFTPERLVSLRYLAGPFFGITMSADGAAVRIGAMTTFAELERSADIAKHFSVVTQTMKTLANARVRNVATVGGNLAHGDPHLDLPPVWMALGARATIVGPSGERTIPVDEIFAGYYENSLARDELIASIDVPVRPGWRARYVKVTTRAAHDWPALGLALALSLDGPRISDVRLVLSAAVDKPTRLAAAEAVLRGATPSDDALRAAGEAAAGEVEMDTDGQGSADYKAQLLRVYLARGVKALAEE